MTISIEKYIKSPFFLMEKDGVLRAFTGTLHALQTFGDLQQLQNESNAEIVFAIPFSAARENGMSVVGAEPIQALQVTQTLNVSQNELNQLVNNHPLEFESAFEATQSDEAFAHEVEVIQTIEIQGGNACQVIYSGTFQARFKQADVLNALLLFRRLQKQTGQYLTFLFSDGAGHCFVGASPERQLEIHDETVIKNPISGTMPKGPREGFDSRLTAFLQDQKEIDELSQILDEELKIMSQICPRGGKITGPFIRETGAVVHTEYRLEGHSKKSAITALKISLHSPTLVGSPLESAFRIIAQREGTSRRYYGGEIGIIESSGDLYSAIMIRTAELFPDGLVQIQAGAGIVKDSIPLNEARETRAKADGLILALLGETETTEKYVQDSQLEQLNRSLAYRNDRFSKFHLEDQIGHRDMSNLHQQSITIINNEDNFALILSHITRYLGYETRVVDTFEFDPIQDTSDLVVLGPGPGDINDENNQRMLRLLEITNVLASRNTPTLGICLGIQAMAKHLGLAVTRQAVPSQGMQIEIELFGKRQRVGVYNSFSAIAENVPDGFEVSVDADQRVMALRSENIYGFQFHVESVMTENGLDILTEALNALMGIRERRRLSFEGFVGKSISGKLNIEAQKEFLLDLNHHGFSGADIADLVNVFYAQMPTELSLPDAIDLCGTGGSGLARINTSTTAAIIVAACGVPVAKHGNKAASGRFGSFDLLEAMGMNIMAEKPRLEALYRNLNLAFIFARSFHPVFKHFAQVRGELKAKTIFNLLGPLLNPANPQYQIIGTSNPDDMELLIEAARALGKKKVMVLCGADGLDELTLTGDTTAMTLENGQITRSTLKPEDFGFKRVAFAEISGGDPDFNLKITQDILAGNCQSAHNDLVLANAALALKFMGKANSLREGVSLARQVIAGGKASQLAHQYALESTVPDILWDIVSQKRQELPTLKKRLPLTRLKQEVVPSDRDFAAALGNKTRLSLIAEIKHSSPSEAEIFKGSFDPGAIARIYEQQGAAAISVLTDEPHFKGALNNLSLAREATQKTPLLMKDFFIDEYQIYLARHYGADAILLIAAILEDAEIERFTQTARSLGMEVLLEVHSQEELERTFGLSPQIIGINNRNLHTFEIDLKTALRLSARVPSEKILVAESGYSAVNLSQIEGLVNAVLVGSALMRDPNLPKAVARFIGPHVKFKACGIRTTESAKASAREHIPFVGFNFVPASKRCITVETARKLKALLPEAIIVGVFQDQSLEEINRISSQVGLDMIQLAGHEDVELCEKIDLPLIKTIMVGELEKVKQFEGQVSMLIIDGSVPGSGKRYDYDRLRELNSSVPLLVAGGIALDNCAELMDRLPQFSGVDVASGLETGGELDTLKIEQISRIMSEVRR